MTADSYIAGVAVQRHTRGRPPVYYVGLDEHGVAVLVERRELAERFDNRRAAEAFAAAYFGHMGTIRAWRVRVRTLTEVTAL